MIKIKNVVVEKTDFNTKRWILKAERVDGQKFFPIRFSTEKQAKDHVEKFCTLSIDGSNI